MNFIENIIGFLWGIVCTLLVVDACFDGINIYWYVWLPLILFIFITTIIGKLYLFISDYKAMAETGWSLTKKLYMYFSKHKTEIVNK